MNQNYALLITAILALGISASVSIFKPEAGAAIAKQSENLISGCIGALGAGALQKYIDNSKKEEPKE